MKDLYNWAKRLLVDVRGQDLIEYALLAGMIAVVIGAMFPQTIMPTVSTIFSKVSSSLNYAPGF
jgi:Flp pilus assembly pilin Flp